jgi:hypothetical protein
MNKNKKAQEGMTIGTIIIIILALVVLVFLIFAFARGGGNLMDYISNIFGGKDNLDTIKNACSVACTANANFAFCEEARSLRISGANYKGTCATLSSQGIETCPTLTCTGTPKTCTAVLGEAWTPSSCAAGSEDITSQVVNSEGQDINKFKCCKVKVQ